MLISIQNLYIVLAFRLYKKKRNRKKKGKQVEKRNFTFINDINMKLWCAFPV